jgi:hypothetical protein
MKRFIKSESFIWTALMFLFGTVFLICGTVKMTQWSLVMIPLAFVFYYIGFITIKDFRNEEV